MQYNQASAETSSSDIYIKKHSHFNAYAELLDPDGLVKSDIIQQGLDGMKPNSDYRIWTRPAEEIYEMLSSDWF